MENLHIGSIINEPQQRDAVHMAIVPVTAMERLYPGTHVGIVQTGEVPKDSDGIVADALDHGLKGIGIVDPFLRNPVQKGERFWLFLYPGSIISLRHDWEHPSFHPREFSEKATRQVTGREKLTECQTSARIWLERYAKSIDVSFEELMEATKDFLENDEYWNQGPKFESEQLPDDFWAYWEAFTNTTVKDFKKYSFFSCSC
jgi:hypothetical protein